MQPIVMILLAPVVGVPLGFWLRRNLATLGYRIGDEQDLPEPGPRWWVVWASVLALGSLAAVASLSGRALAYLPILPLTLAGPWLAAVDFDVLRIPNRVLVPTGAATLLAVVSTSAATREGRALIVPVACALMTSGVFVAIHLATKGGIGFGDAKLVAVIGLAVGSLGAGAVWLSVLSGSVAALIWAKTTRQVGSIAYGPWLLCGALLAGIAGAWWLG